ncbi:hypothetical protein V496_00689, partial [Pseudogymnoascus sp. VKM F-4515 (FW-2607)]
SVYVWVILYSDSTEADRQLQSYIAKTKSFELFTSSRRLAQDHSHSHSHKLEPRWMGPYIVQRITAQGKSAVLQELHSDEIKGKFHLNDLKLFVERKEHNSLDEPWQDHFMRNEETRLHVLRFQRNADKEISQQATIMREQGIPIDDGGEEFPQDQPKHQPQPNPVWWDEFVHHPVDTAGEHDPAYWMRRRVQLNPL